MNRTVFVVTHGKQYLIDGVFSTIENAQEYIKTDMAERGNVDWFYYQVCLCTIDQGDSCYIRSAP